MEVVCEILQENINLRTELYVTYDGMSYMATITSDDGATLIASATGKKLADALENLALKLKPGGMK